jgi:transposase-like protein
MEERLRFVARLLEGEGMSAVCREFGISRKTGYKIFNRYRETEQFQEDAEVNILGETERKLGEALEKTPLKRRRLTTARAMTD